MDSRTRAVMETVFNGLSEDKLDDLESEFENLQVLWEQTIQEVTSTGHWPALELHAGEVAEDFMYKVQQAAAEGLITDFREVKQTLFDNFRACMVFGMLVGRSGWPVRKRQCNEVHL